MSPHDDHLVREGRAFDLGDQIVGVRAGHKVALHLEQQLRLLISVLHSLKHLGVFDGNGRRGYFGVFFVIAQKPGVRRVNREGRHTSDQAGAEVNY